jgi:membrane associated rhomboid family serine protease
VNYYRFSSIYDELISMGVTPEAIQEYLVTKPVAFIETSLTTDSKLGMLNMLYKIPALGASGAIYGVLVAFGMSFPNAKMALIFIPFPIAAKYFIPILIGIDLFSGVTGFSLFGGGVAHFGHVGGAIIGFLLMWYWRDRVPRPPIIE